MELRLAIVTNRVVVHAWEYEMVRRVLSLSTVHLVSVLVDRSARDKHAGNRILDLYWKIDRRLFRASPDAFEPRDLTTLTRELPVREIGGSGDSINNIGELRLDVILSLRPPGADDALAKLARFGVWSVGQNDGLEFCGGPPGFWELEERSPVVGSTLVMAQDDGVPKTLFRSYSRVHKHSWSKGRGLSLWKTSLFAARKIEELSRNGGEVFLRKAAEDSRTPVFRSRPVRRSPSALQSIRFVIRRFWGMLAEWLSRLFLFDQWELAFKTGTEFSTSFAEFSRVTPGRDRFWADPHVVCRDGRAYIFLEEYPYATGRGHISVIQLDERGEMGPPERVLERPYHLSYPFLLEQDGQLYMIPETRDNGTIELYTCLEFPLKWEFSRTLMKDTRAVDATVVQHQGKWWLFANMAQHEGVEMSEELFLFWSDDFMSDRWQAHPMNPVVSDVRSARPAGPVFIQGGKLFRPSQDSSVEYGGGLNFQEILTMTETEYREVPVASFKPDWNPRVNGMHTYCHKENLTVIDLRVATRKW